MKKTQKIILSVLSLCSIAMFAVGGALITPASVYATETTGLSQSFVSDGTEDSFWDNKNISLPAKYYTTATV
ncbi:MAG: hypothetical protein ACI4SH_06080, partial [Candidatus Scatosoma sp.]